MEKWIFLIYGLFLTVLGLSGFCIFGSGVITFGIVGAKGAFLAFGIYGVFVTSNVIKYWDV